MWFAELQIIEWCTEDEGLQKGLRTILHIWSNFYSNCFSRLDFRCTLTEAIFPRFCQKIVSQCQMEKLLTTMFYFWVKTLVKTPIFMLADSFIILRLVQMMTRNESRFGKIHIHVVEDWWLLEIYLPSLICCSRKYPVGLPRSIRLLCATYPARLLREAWFLRPPQAPPGVLFCLYHAQHECIEIHCSKL
jgi:hypothetical protein